MVVDYDGQAMKWHRDEPKHHSDFCGRPEIFEMFQKVGKGKTVIDLGCGEGYFSRKMADIADKVIGVDSSKEMIRLAREREQKEKRGIDYYWGLVDDMPSIQDSTIDIAVGNYITNYFRPEELPAFYKETARILKDNGLLLLLMPHPVFELTTDFGEAIRYDISEYTYRFSRGNFYTAKLATVQGDTLEVGLYHSTLQDHFDAMHSANIVVSAIREPVFPEKVAEKYPVFKEMAGKVACMILAAEKHKP
ncbi:class I SAM-dependent methyltransferase [Candidatus Woesearchaeota archaeon]|nr:class I SAM-dependent methyltransferase [Candidatus Woesearchaeota archaeon]